MTGLLTGMPGCRRAHLAGVAGGATAPLLRGMPGSADAGLRCVQFCEGAGGLCGRDLEHRKAQQRCRPSHRPAAAHRESTVCDPGNHVQEEPEGLPGASSRRMKR